MVDMGTVSSSSGKGRNGISGWNGREEIIGGELAVTEKIMYEMWRMYWIGLKIAEDDYFKIRVSRFERNYEVIKLSF